VMSAGNELGVGFSQANHLVKAVWSR
jgi:hypothetical protein